jgi:hypothetical protein
MGYGIMARFHNIDGTRVQFTAAEEAARDADEKVWRDDDMKTYRQALRDLPSGKDTVAKCKNATFPTKP